MAADNPPPGKAPATNSPPLTMFLDQLRQSVFLLWRKSRKPDLGVNLIANFETLGIVSDPPASAGAAGVAGTITWNSTHIFICVATNTWKRVAIATW
jgi:hypothetical protein